MAKLTDKKKEELTEKEKELAESGVKNLINRVEAWEKRYKDKFHEISKEAVYSLALSYIHHEFSWLPKEYQDEVLNKFNDKQAVHQ